MVPRTIMNIAVVPSRTELSSQGIPTDYKNRARVTGTAGYLIEFFNVLARIPHLRNRYCHYCHETRPILCGSDPA